MHVWTRLQECGCSALALLRQALRMPVHAAPKADRRLTKHAMQCHAHDCGQFNHRTSVTLGQVRYQWKKDALSGCSNVMSPDSIYQVRLMRINSCNMLALGG